MGYRVPLQDIVSDSVAALCREALLGSVVLAWHHASRLCLAAKSGVLLLLPLVLTCLDIGSIWKGSLL